MSKIMDELMPVLTTREPKTRFNPLWVKDFEPVSDDASESEPSGNVFDIFEYIRKTDPEFGEKVDAANADATPEQVEEFRKQLTDEFLKKSTQATIVTINGDGKTFNYIVPVDILNELFHMDESKAATRYDVDGNVKE